VQWPLIDLVSLQLHGKLTNADRIRLVEQFPTLEDAFNSIGAFIIDRTDAERCVEECLRNSVDVVTFWDDRYPRRLRAIDQPPPILYVAGTLPPEDAPSVAVVGTRSCTTQYGKPATEQLVRSWVARGCVIISGLANGIDTIAHEACVRSSGTTVAVIASGIGRITPINAQRLSERIRTTGGAVVSEHPYHVAALPPYFPARNRIISGMSDAVIVVESKSTGGALITADFAIKQQRTVWAVPGPITSSRSEGTNALINTGAARMLMRADDVLEELGVSDENNERAANTRRIVPPDLELLGDEPVHIDRAAQLWSISISDAMIKLFEYELAGAVHQLPGCWYRVVR